MGENEFDLCVNEFDLGEHESVGGAHGPFKSAISSFSLYTNQYRPRTAMMNNCNVIYQRDTVFHHISERELETGQSAEYV